MSKSCSPHRLYLLALAIGLLFAISAYAQDMAVSIKIQPGPPSIALIEGRSQKPGGHRELRFLTDYAHLSKLADRISGVQLFAENGKTVASHLAGPGRYIGESDFNAWTYRVDITPFKDRFAAAHLTWGTLEAAMITPDDLLPQDQRTAKITFELPEGWNVSGGGRSSNTNIFEIADPGKAVFHAGRGLRSTTARSGNSVVELSLLGEWRFSDDEAAKMAVSILETYVDLFGEAPSRRMHITLRPFPNPVPLGQWEGNSRGSSITIVSSDMPFKSQSLQRLHEQLRHEIFHLWIPNSVNLTGNYDWFYEGFGLYQSLKSGVAVNRIRFDDLLDTLSRAYDIGYSRGNKVSLIEASESRWRGSNTQVYAQGMLVAFACDLVMLRASKGKRSIAHILRSIYTRYRADTPPRKANEAILDLLRSYPELRQIADASITSSAPIDWPELLKSAGLELYERDQLARIKVIDAPSGGQREVLERLGYNNWRKLPRN